MVDTSALKGYIPARLIVVPVSSFQRIPKYPENI